MKAINKIISQYDSVSLKDLDNVKLLNRVDTKFVCSLSRLKIILQDLSLSYKVLEIEGKRIMSYQTKYYDTFDFKMYHEHQNGKLNRYKIREREYVNSALNFLEIKFKNNKRRTLKSRIIKASCLNSFSNTEVDFLDSKSPFSTDELEIKLFNRFNRITLSNGSERVTIDFNLKFDDGSGNRGDLPSISIVEVKQSKYSADSDVIHILKNHQIRPCSFSKYCIGVSLVYPNLKTNRFKPKLLLINKISA